MQNQTPPVSRAEFEEWKESFITKAVMKVLGMHAFDVKILALEQIWQNENADQNQQLFIEKRAAQAKVEVIEDLQSMTYDGFISYFKSE